jgi:16S rRNA (cytosine967-C5)-methyltransferase
MPTAAGRVDARSVARELLRAVVRDGVPLDEALAGHAGYLALERRDRAFARNLVATALRRLGQIDALIDHCLERPLPRSADGVRDVLRLGLAQLGFLRTPPHAAVDRTVAELTGPLAGFRGLANAVMRRLAREGDALIAAQDAARLDTPPWLFASWSATYGAARAERIAAASLVEAPLDLTAKGPAGALAERLGATLLPTGTLRLRSAGPVADLPGYAEGAWWVQDAAAALPAKVLISGLGGAAGRRIADLCAAPGGKTAQLAAAGAQVTAVDDDAGRLARLADNLSRLGLEAETVRGDAATWRDEASFDGVLLDAPCSGTGAIRRHPDIPHLKTARDVARLALAQRRLLAGAAANVRPGGLLVYSVCSLQPEEGPGVIDAFLAAHDDFERLPVAGDEIGGLNEAITPAGDVLTLPYHLGERGGMDGFHIARLRRRGSAA